jgi:DNA-binding IclR family transcriptional regulator
MTRCTRNSAGDTTQGNGTMTYKFALGATLAMLMTVSGQAFAAAPSDRQAAYTATAFGQTTATHVDAATAYRYHGGPKYGD